MALYGRKISFLKPMLKSFHVSNGMIEDQMKQEQILNVIEDLKPAIEAITDNNIKTIINALLAIINEQQKTIEIQKKEIESLKEKLNTNSDNSSKPPSSNLFKGNKNSNKKKDKRNRGGQAGHPGVTRNLLPESEVNYIEKHQPPSLCECGGDVKAIDEYSRHQVHDIPPITTLVTEYQLFLDAVKAAEKHIKQNFHPMHQEGCWDLIFWR